MSTTPSRLRKNITAISLVAAGVAGGGILASTVAANASDSPASSTSSTSSTAGNGGSATQRPAVDESKSQRSDEHLLTGTDADKARAAALAKYPGATIQRVETDSDGVYEAHLVTAGGQRVTVEMDKSFTVTGTESNASGRGGHAGTGGSANGSGTTTG